MCHHAGPIKTIVSKFYFIGCQVNLKNDCSQRPFLTVLKSSHPVVSVAVTGD